MTNNGPTNVGGGGTPLARLHLKKVGVKLSVLSQAQADYLGVPVEGPYKPEHYRY